MSSYWNTPYAGRVRTGAQQNATNCRHHPVTITVREYVRNENPRSFETREVRKQACACGMALEACTDYQRAVATGSCTWFGVCR